MAGPQLFNGSISDASDNEDLTPESKSVDEEVLAIIILKMIQVLWLLAGLSLMTCVAICVFVSVGYLVFKTSGSLVIVCVAFIYLINLLFQFWQSLVQTFLLLSRHHIFRQQRYGGGRKDMHLLRWIDAHPLTRQWIKKELVLIVVCSIVIGVPLITVARLYGYWILINVLCVVLTLASAAVLILTNLVHRVGGLWHYLRKTCKESTPHNRRLAAYLASTGNDVVAAGSMLDQWCQTGIRWSALIFVTSTLFSLQRIIPWVTIACGTVAGVLALILMRRLLPCYTRMLKRIESDHLAEDSQESLLYEYQQLESTSAVNDQNAEQSQVKLLNLIERTLSQLEMQGGHHGSRIGCHALVAFVFTARTLLTGVGIAAILYLDVTDVRSANGESAPISRSIHDTPTQLLFYLCGAFYLATVLKDLSMIVPLPRLVRILSLLIFQSAQIALAAYGYQEFVSFTATALVLMTVCQFQYAEGKRYRQGNTSYARHRERDVRRARASRNSMLILVTCVAVGLISVITSVKVTQGRDGDTDYAKFAELLNNLPLHRGNPTIQNVTEPAYGWSSPMCSMEFTSEQLTLIEMGVFSFGAYEQTVQGALKAIHQVPSLRDWQAGLYSLSGDSDSPYTAPSNVSNVAIKSGIRFIEYRHAVTNVSVIATRGTHNMGDIWQDMYLWLTPWMLQLSSYAATLVNLWPLETVAWANALIANFASYPNLIYWGELEAIVERIILDKSASSASDGENSTTNNNSTDGGNSTTHENDTMQIKKAHGPPLSLFASLFPEPQVDQIDTDDRDDVIMTGHSLGAGLAFIVASHLRIPAVGYSGPGLGYSTFNYNISRHQLMTKCLNVVPINDPVPKFDLQISLVQNIECDQGVVGIDCHSLERSITTIANTCQQHERVK